MTEQHVSYHTKITFPDTVELRLSGAPASVQALAAWLRGQGLVVQQEHGDYPDREGSGLNSF